MQVGLKNVPGTFQRSMDVILASLRWQMILLYLVDITIYSKTAEEHINHVRKALKLLQEAEVTSKRWNC